MKAIEIDDAIRRDPGLFSAVERATKRIEEEIGPSAESVSLEWKLFVADQILPTIRLRISDWTGSAMTHFQRAIIEKMIENCD